ncbi:hypothetical protein FG115_03725 [Fructilactobacillus sanfranciscensis]|nr:hypothetical protein [Fructilactobacillus sanfranciscensis]NDR62002.1 hypothetical protein [Fructilactobacillus sanfranciscensis]
MFLCSYINIIVEKLGLLKEKKLPQKEKPKPTSPEFYHQTDQVVIEEFHTDIKTGLTTTTAKVRLKKDGYNELDSKPVPKWQILIQQFNNIIYFDVSRYFHLADASLFRFIRYYDCNHH